MSYFDENFSIACILEVVILTTSISAGDKNFINSLRLSDAYMRQ